jgi:hypothetical protein
MLVERRDKKTMGYLYMHTKDPTQEYREARKNLLAQQADLDEQYHQILSSQEHALSQFTDDWRWLNDTDLNRLAQYVGDDQRDIVSQQFKSSNRNIEDQLNNLDTHFRSDLEDYRRAVREEASK